MSPASSARACRKIHVPVPRLGLPFVPPSLDGTPDPFLVHSSRQGRAGNLASEDALRVDVDRDARSSRGASPARAAGESRRRPRGDRRGGVGLDEELRSVAAAEPQERRRAEQVGGPSSTGELGAELGEDAPGPAAPGPETTMRTRWRKGG